MPFALARPQTEQTAGMGRISAFTHMTGHIPCMCHASSQTKPSACNMCHSSRVAERPGALYQLACDTAAHHELQKRGKTVHSRGECRVLTDTLINLIERCARLSAA